MNRCARCDLPQHYSARAAQSEKFFVISVSAVQHAGLRASTLFPSGALKLRSVALDLRIAEAEIADETPALRNVENACSCAPDRESKPSPCRCPRRAPRATSSQIAVTAEYSAISGMVRRPRPCPTSVVRSANTANWHGASSSPASLSAAYLRRQLARIGFERVGVAGLEGVANVRAAGGIVDHDEPPRLAQAHRWRETRRCRSSVRACRRAADRCETA